MVRRPDNETEPEEGEKSGHQSLPQAIHFQDSLTSLHTVRLNQGPAGENPHVFETLYYKYGRQEEIIRWEDGGNLYFHRPRINLSPVLCQALP